MQLLQIVFMSPEKPGGKNGVDIVQSIDFSPRVTRITYKFDVGVKNRRRFRLLTRP
jgi:hypothetical protein